MDCHKDIQELRCTFLRCLMSAAEETSVKALGHIYSSLKIKVTENRLKDEEKLMLLQISREMKACTSLLLKLEKESLNIVTDTTREVNAIFTKKWIDQANVHLFGRQRETSKSDTCDSNVLRDWFLANIVNPFPSAESKENLTTSSNLMSYDQCQLWFINGRRRSGWTAFFRTFALSDTKRMQQLVDIFRRDTQENKVSDLELSRVLALDKFGRVQLSGFHLEQHIRSCRENWSRMMAWLQQPNAEEVGDWMDRIVIEARAELEAEEARLKEEKETIDSSIPQIKSPVESRKKEIQAKKGITATRRSKRLRMQNSASHKRPAKKRNLSGESSVSTCSSLFDTQSTVSSHSSTGYDGMEAESP